MTYLLDTGVWLWSLSEPERIARRARDVIGDLSQQVFLSAVTAWEVAIKAGTGKLTLSEPPGSYVPRRMTDQGLRPLPITHQHALAVAALPYHHHDPFDRLLIAQANLEGMTVITSDRAFEKYSVQILWARR
jgi:PIN domain nuclease of toxin-antitoxin system